VWEQEDYDERVFSSETRSRKRLASDVNHAGWRMAMEASVTRESVLDLDPGPARDVAIAIGRTWLGAFDSLLVAVDAVSSTPTL
jgi:hypothetical protein